VAPGKLLVVHDQRSIGPDGNMVRATVGTFVTVTRD
jgi:hypothetical protein